MISDPSQITLFAQTNFRGQRKRFGIKIDDRRRHMYLIGKTGMGKSNTLEHMIISDIRAGHGVSVVDPHGELIDRVLDFIPPDRINDVIYFNPADLDWPIGFNILEGIDITHKHLIASGLMSVFTKIWENVWSARMEYILNNCILALLDSPGNTLLGINRLFVDDSYRKKIIANIKDPVVKSFWVDEYAHYDEKYLREAIAPIQNKVGQFLSSAIIRNIVGQSKSTIEMRNIMDTGKILLMDLSKGRIGEDNSRLLGAMMVTRMQLSAMTRVDIPESQRRDFFLYVDEFQNFATESFASTLSEARKYHLALTLAHQYIAQLDELVQAAIFGNVGTLIVFRVGAADALMLAPEFAPKLTEEDLVNLTKFDMYLKLMIDGVASQPFSATGLAPFPSSEKENNRETVIAKSRERYAQPRVEVEDNIAKWSGFNLSPEEKPLPSIVITPMREVRPQRTSPSPATPTAPPREESFRKKRQEQPPRREEPREEPKVKEPERAPAPSAESARHASCSFCGKDTMIYFDPEPGRPVYCKDCWKKKKSGELDQMMLTALKEAEQKGPVSDGITFSEALKMSPPPRQKKEPEPEKPKVKVEEQVLEEGKGIRFE
ncbi:MAG: type IV secretion system DNA-binding domain-containing protein [bacterium]|nr:type IV secretion system DNA-binding domain-containing protein [bacterium]